MGKTFVTSSATRLKYSVAFQGSWFQLLRPMTWTGTLSPITAGTIYALLYSSFDVSGFVILMLAALMVQSSANMLNDYFDFKNGQDKERWTYHNDKQKFRPVFHQIPYVAATTFAIAILLGIWIGSQYGWWMFILGLVGILAASFYSAGKKSLAAIGLGETVAAVFLGFVPFMLGYAVQGAPMTPLAFIVAMPYVILISSMILTNNIRDIHKDAGFRKTVPMRTGRKSAVFVLRSLIAGAYIIVVGLVAFHILSWFVLVVFAALPKGIQLWRAVSDTAGAEQLALSMKYAALHHWHFGLLYIFGMLLTSFM
ncbi:MAG TPA: prenyltransferase [Pseudogracilibacillus sp.]|nr:prenyltransferase [Pseudogracilibacillus sp.]